ncbi:ABC transporter permease [Kutzneria buriramensis]|uniref:NitT/TauT family transport system permease protein n=1 Tax=Kutzneria buriramensis TaxID=1045776 RepID=A0A3E0H7C8_9PSEU|nr:ABC transporter permease [Kutzneria buriramensis]REH39351.1 NitT/TauT family transport system permease protein [Kutzneria buriramensis]
MTAQEAQVEVTAVESAHRRAARRHRVLVHLTQLAVLVVVLGGWQLTVQDNPRSVILYGVPSGILGRLTTWVTEGTAIGSLGDQIATTLEEALIGFAIGTALGIVCGVALGRVRFLSEVFGPFIKVLNAIPRIVLGAVFVLAFGLGIESKILLVIVLVFFGVFFNAFQGTREVDRNFIANAGILGASRWQVTSQVVLPSAFTWIIASLHVSFGFALIGAIVGEFLGATSGLGVLIKQAEGTFDANGVWAAMVIMAVVALAAEWLITRLENRLLRWRPAQLAGPDL